MSAPGLPPGLLLAFYGDDFTGSASVMEVMTFAGLPAVMFLDPPGREDLDRFAGRRAVGIASVARSQSPQWMDAHLPGAFGALASLGAPITHYKICSTLDSSATVGSIGRAVDIAATVFGRDKADHWVPVVVAAPAIGRYQAFGNLFAAHGEDVYRLDRHPVMQRHPVTPMHEADVRRHLAGQTEQEIGLVDCAAIKSGAGADRLDAELRAGRAVVALDVVDDETLRWVGETIWSRRDSNPFVVGSHGVEFALVAHWRAVGALPQSHAAATAAEMSQILVVSGSVSSVTAKQIEWAAANGFDVIDLDAAAAIEDGAWSSALDEAANQARRSLARGGSPLIASARGPGDPRIERLKTALSRSNLDMAFVTARIGTGLGALLRDFVTEGRIARASVSGGDTSGFALRALGIFALEAMAPLASGAPLCRAHSRDKRVDGFEVALKGGQIGGAEFFGSVRAGRLIS